MKKIIFATLFVGGFSVVSAAQVSKSSKAAAETKNAGTISEQQAYDKKKAAEAEKLNVENSNQHKQAELEKKKEMESFKKRQDEREANPEAAKLQDEKTKEVIVNSEKKEAEKKASAREREKQSSRSVRLQLAEKARAEVENQQ